MGTYSCNYIADPHLWGHTLAIIADPHLWGHSPAIIADPQVVGTYSHNCCKS